MGILKELIKLTKEKKISLEEEKFNNYSDVRKMAILDSVKELTGKELEKAIESKPYYLPHIIGKIEDEILINLVNIATKKGVSVYDLIDKSNVISNTVIVNIAVVNQPELVLELDDMPELQDLITSKSLIEAFIKNPEVVFSECKALNSKVILRGKDRTGKDITRVTTLKKQFQRAINLYFRPNAYKGNKLDNFAKSIADRIDNVAFKNIIGGNRMTTRLSTAANETLKADPEKARVFPAKALKNWNNRTLYVVPNEVRKAIKNQKVNYSEYYGHMLGELNNPSLNSFSQKERTNFAKKCVAICPEIFFALDKIKAFADISKMLTVQLSAYEAFKDNKQLQKEVLKMVDPEQQKKLLAKVKSNETRRANKQKTKNDAEIVMEIK